MFGSKVCECFDLVEVVVAGLTRQSIAFRKSLPKWMDTRVKPAYDVLWV
jgi:hypothetical protein